MTLHIHFSRYIFQFVLIAGVGGCGILPRSPQRPAEPSPPATWHDGRASETAAPVSSSTDPWWQKLQDRQLDVLQQQALVTNVDTLRKGLSLQSALTQARLTALDQQPRPGLTLSNSNSRALQSGDTSVVINGVNVPVSTAASTSHSYSINAGISYELDLWSKLSAATQSDLANAESRREDLRSARWLVSTKVAEAYWTIAAIDAKLPLLMELSDAADEALRIAQVRLKEGKLRADEVDVVVTKQFDARKRFAGAQADRRLQLNELAVLLDREPPALALGEARLPSGEPVQPALGQPAQTLARRADVRQARLAVDAALARLHVAEASRYPSLNMNLNLATNGSTWSTWFSQPLATLGLGLAIPIVDWRRLNAQRDMAHDALDDAALALRAGVRQALLDVEGALIERERWRQGWQAAQVQKSEKEKVYAVARLRQEVGVFGRLDVLQSREGLLTAQIDIIDLRLKAWLNLLDLYKALGGAV